MFLSINLQGKHEGIGEVFSPNLQYRALIWLSILNY